MEIPEPPAPAIYIPVIPEINFGFMETETLGILPFKIREFRYMGRHKDKHDLVVYMEKQ